MNKGVDVFLTLENDDFGSTSSEKDAGEKSADTGNESTILNNQLVESTIDDNATRSDDGK